MQERGTDAVRPEDRELRPSSDRPREVAAGRHEVTLIPGDGVGPEVVAAARRVVEATGAPIAWDLQEAGETAFGRGIATGVPPETIASIARTRVVLKGPLGTPTDGGEKSANVTLRTYFETYGNIRPVRDLPGVPTPFAGRGIDLVVVRENVEDLYAGIEHLQTPGVAQALKLTSRKGCEKIVRLAFELAHAEGRATVHCATKASVLKLTEGMLRRTFEAIAPEYPGIRAEHIAVDTCAHQLARRPERFDVIVTANMSGDILSDLASGLTGGLGFAPSMNLGDEVAIFEAVHGVASRHAGRGVINPTAMILSAALLLRHLDLFAEADAIERSVLVTLEDGAVRTYDVAGDEGAATTEAYTEAVVANLGRSPGHAPIRQRSPLRMANQRRAIDFVRPTRRRVVGVDVFVETALGPEALGRSAEGLAEGTPLALKMVSNRGAKVYPLDGGEPVVDTVDLYRCRYLLRDAEENPEAELDDGAILDLVAEIARYYRWVHLEKLQEFDGEAAYTLAHGED